MRRKWTFKWNKNKWHILPGSGTSIPHLILEEFSLDLFTLPLIPYKSPRKYKNNSRQPLWRFGLVCQGSDCWVPCLWSRGDTWKKKCLGLKNHLENQKHSIRKAVSLGGSNRCCLGRSRGEADPQVPGRGNFLLTFRLCQNNFKNCIHVPVVQVFMWNSHCCSHIIVTWSLCGAQTNLSQRNL